jgi:hypothetical protein
MRVIYDVQGCCDMLAVHACHAVCAGGESCLKPGLHSLRKVIRSVRRWGNREMEGDAALLMLIANKMFQRQHLDDAVHILFTCVEEWDTVNAKFKVRSSCSILHH